MQNFLKAKAEYIDSTYKVENHRNYRLSIQLRLDGFSFAVFSVDTNQILKLQEYKSFFQKDTSQTEKWQKINELLLDVIETESQAYLSFKKVSIILDHKEYHLQANIFADKRNQYRTTSFNQSIDFPHSFIDKEAVGIESFVSFALPSSINNTIQDYFENAQVLHISNILNNSIRIQHQNKALGLRLYVYISNRDVHIMAFDKELIFTNAYKYSTKEDFIYFILLAYEQLGMNPEKHPIYLMGEISRSSALFNIIWQYIRNVHFMGNQISDILSREFDQLPIHQYYLLLQSDLCE